MFVTISLLLAACTAPKCRGGSDLRVSLSRLRSTVVLVDQAAEYLPALHRRGQWHDDHLVMIGWPLVPGLVLEEITRQQALCLGAQEPPPGRGQTARSGSAAAGAEDTPHSRLTDLVAQAGQLAVHPAVSPGRVLPRQPQHQVADLLASPLATRPSRVGPFSREETAMPGQQRSRGNQPTA